MKVWTVLYPLVVFVSIRDVTARFLMHELSDKDNYYSAADRLFGRLSDIEPEADRLFGTLSDIEPEADRLFGALSDIEPEALPLEGFPDPHYITQDELVEFSDSDPNYSREITQEGSSDGDLLYSTDFPVTTKRPTEHAVIANETKYHVVTSKQLNWFEASMYCQLGKRRLATVTSKEENDNIVETIKQAIAGIPEKASLRFWIGGTDLAREGQWSWLSTGKLIVRYMDYTNWSTWQPDNSGGQENCLQYWRGIDNVNEVFEWNDHTCSHSFFFICESVE